MRPPRIALALVLAILQPRLNRLLAARKAAGRAGRRHLLLAPAIYLTGVYGGYFGAAQGILLLGILGVTLDQDLHRTNALKNVLAGLVNGVAGVYFVFAAHVDWGPAGIIAGVLQPVVVNNRLRNVPAEAVYNWDPGAFFGIYHPDQFWFAEAGVKSAANEPPKSK